MADKEPWSVESLGPAAHRFLSGRIPQGILALFAPACHGLFSFIERIPLTPSTVPVLQTT